MKICAVSDLHGQLPIIEPCDLLLIAGDIIPLSLQTKYYKSLSWVFNRDSDFVRWINEIDCKEVVCVAGNHDFALETSQRYNCDKYFNKPVKFLYNKEYEYNGIKIWGSPYCKIFGNWAFNTPNYLLEEMYNEIPDNIDILLTHDAPDIGEIGVIHQGWDKGTRCGNAVLKEAIKKKKPKYSISGHIHSGEHSLQTYDECPDTQFACVSILDENYQMSYKPLVFEI